MVIIPQPGDDAVGQCRVLQGNIYYDLSFYNDI